MITPHTFSLSLTPQQQTLTPPAPVFSPVQWEPPTGLEESKTSCLTYTLEPSTEKDVKSSHVEGLHVERQEPLNSVSQNSLASNDLLSVLVYALEQNAMLHHIAEHKTYGPHLPHSAPPIFDPGGPAP